MFDLSREAAALQEALKVRADLRLRLDDLLVLQGKLDTLGQSLKLAEREARKIGLRQSVVGLATDPHDLDTSVLLQAEANAAFRDLSGSLRVMSDHIARLRMMIPEWDEIITKLQPSFDHAQGAHA